MTLTAPVEVWGTFSVKDHARPRPFVADVMLYDRLVIPYPPDEAETLRWRAEGWQPSRLHYCLDILGDLAVPVKWDAERREAFRSRWAAAKELDPFYVSSLQLQLELKGIQPERIPRGVEKVRPIAAYPSRSAFDKQVALRVKSRAHTGDVGSLAAVLAREFLVPDDPSVSDLKLLAQAVKLASDPEFREKRSAFHQWLEDVIERGLGEHDAVAELRSRVAEYNGVLRRFRIRKRAKFAFLVTKVGLLTIAGLGTAGALAVPAVAPVLGDAAILLAEYGVLDRQPEPQVPQNTPAAMFYAARRHFGWK